jgi:hypothetical protein
LLKATGTREWSLSGYTMSRHGIHRSGNHRRYHLSPRGMFVLYLFRWLSQAVKPLSPTLAVLSLPIGAKVIFTLAASIVLNTKEFDGTLQR